MFMITMSLCLSLSLVVWCCSCLWIFVHLFSTSGSLSSPANRLRLSGSGTTMALKCPLLVFQEFNAIPCKSHWNCPIGRATKTRFVWIYHLPHIFPWKNGQNCGVNPPSTHHRLHTWARSRAGRTVLNLAQTATEGFFHGWEGASN